METSKVNNTKHKYMAKVVGGDYEYKEETLYSYLTDSGRSSLRLILKSLSRKRKFLVPDFLCQTILNVFKEEGIKFDYYHIKEDLSIDDKSIRDMRNYDVLYIIDYFGHKDSFLSRIKSPDLLVIEDAAFLPVLEKPVNIPNWIGFNSFRKISFMADGSSAKSTLKLREDFVLDKEAEFSKIKYKVKNIKYNYIHQDLYSMKKYLSLDEKAKRLINEQRNIHRISKKSLFNLLNFYYTLAGEHKKRKENYKILKRYLGKRCMNIKPCYFSFCLLLVERRDELREHLFKHNIFLPVHWPRMGDKRLSNSLYDRAISIPVDSRYGLCDMKRIADLINRFYSIKSRP